MLAPNINVTVSEHPTLNLCKLVVTSREFLIMTDSEILEGLKSQKVVEVKRINRWAEGSSKPTASVILTMDTNLRPKKIKVGFEFVDTRPYYPRPMRCITCLRYGHPARECKVAKICAKCGEESHGDDVQCPNPPKCVNCPEGKQSHSALSTDCPVWIKENKIVRLKVDKNISHFEARKIVEKETQTGPTYASTTAIGANGCNCKCSCNSPKNPSQKPTLDKIVPTANTNEIKQAENASDQVLGVPGMSYIPDINAIISETFPSTGYTEQQKATRQNSTPQDISPPSSPASKKNRTIPEISSDETLKSSRKDESKTPQPKRKSSRTKKKPAAKSHNTNTSNADTDGADEMSI